MALASSSSLHPEQGQHAGAHSGLTHPDGGPQNPPASAPSGEVPEQAAPVLFTRCGWCKAVMVDGPLSPEGLESTGICKPCGDKMTRRVAAAIVGPLVVRPVPGLGRYEIVDQKGRRIAHPLFSLNAAAAVAHILNQGLERDGICLLHLQVNRIDGTCFSCEHGFGSSPYAVARS